MQKQINEDTIYKSKVHLAMVNHRAVPKDSVINPCDRLCSPENAWKPHGSLTHR
jgi:hypothetical protein